MKYFVVFSLVSIFYVSQKKLLQNGIVLKLPSKAASPLFCLIHTTTISDHFPAPHGFQQMIISSIGSCRRLTKRCTHYLISFDDRSWRLLIEVLKRLFFAKKWNNRSYFIFITESQFDGRTSKTYGNLMDFFGVTNSVLIFWNPAMNASTLNGWNYFANRMENFKSFSTMENHLKTDHLRNVFGSSFRASFEIDIPSMLSINESRYGGSFVQAIKVYANHINASLHWHQGLARTSTEKRNKLFANAGIDIAPNVGYNNPHIGYMYGSMSNYLVLLIPEKINEPFYKNLLIPFSTAVWIFIAAMLTSSSTLHRFFERYFVRNMLLMIFFGSKTAGHKLTTLERLVLVCFMINFFLLCESYLAIMLSYMLNTKYQPHLQTLDELEQSSLSICLRSGKSLAAYKNFFNVVSPKLEDRVVIKNFSNHWYDVESCSWVMRYEVAEVFLVSSSNYERGTMRRKMYVLPQMLSWLTRVHSVSRLRPFGDHFGSVLRRMIEAGFWKYWNDLVMGKMLQSQKWGSFIVFSFYDLISLWYILAYGYLLCTIVFVGEIFFKKIVKA